MRQEIVDKIGDQALDEIQKARTFKQGKTSTWRLNEEMYYSRKLKSLESRANVQLSRMQEFVHTFCRKWTILCSLNTPNKRIPRPSVSIG